MVEEKVVKDGVLPSGHFDSVPFRKKHLDEDLEGLGREILTLRLNSKERAQINRLKRVLHYGQDAKVIKAGLVLLENVVHGTFGADLMTKLTDPDRRRIILEDDDKP